MHTNNTNLIYPKLSYCISGICFGVHNSLGRYAREKQYSDEIARALDAKGISFKRELCIRKTGNIPDFLIEEKIILEIKAKPVILKTDYFQIQRYLQISQMKLGLLVNFRNRYLKPIRVIKIDTEAKKKFLLNY
jgi:GxxExxY protein